MRQVKREYVLTTYKVNEMVDGKVVELGEIVIEGEPNMALARSKSIKQWADKNTVIGECTTDKAVYRMDVETFLKYATKERVCDEVDGGYAE